MRRKIRSAQAGAFFCHLGYDRLHQDWPHHRRLAKAAAGDVRPDPGVRASIATPAAPLVQSARLKLRSCSIEDCKTRGSLDILIS